LARVGGQSSATVNSLSHYTDWTIGHVHAGALGWVAMISIGPVLMIALQSIGRAQSEDAQLLLRMSSPITAPWEMLQNRIWTGQHAVVSPAHWRAAWMTGCMAVAAWILVAIIRGASGSKLAQTKQRA